MSIRHLIRTMSFAIFASIGAAPVLAEQQFTAFLNGFSYWDSMPNGSGQIVRPVAHHKAGGSGTYSDPITLAVGHTPQAKRSAMAFPAGTRFYIPRLRKYAIVEDLCEVGSPQQSGPCQGKNKGHIALNIYVDGKKAGGQNADWCMSRLTGMQSVIINPDAGWPVKRGAITESGCQIF